MYNTKRSMERRFSRQSHVALVYIQLENETRWWEPQYFVLKLRTEINLNLSKKTGIREMLRQWKGHNSIGLFIDKQALIWALGATNITSRLVWDCACALNELEEHIKVTLAGYEDTCVLKVMGKRMLWPKKWRPSYWLDLYHRVARRKNRCPKPLINGRRAKLLIGRKALHVRYKLRNVLKIIYLISQKTVRTKRGELRS